MIELENVTHAVPGKVLFRNLSATIHAGQRVGLTGISGCGKTTLLRLIAGLDAPGRGTIRLDGHEASSTGRIIIPPHLRKIGFVFQSPSLWPHMTVAQNILFGLGKMTDTTAAGTLERVLAQTGAAHLSDRMPDTLSGGEQQRVALARALAPGPEVLLLDEPLANLDAGAKSDLTELIRASVADSKATLIFVSHDPRDTQKFCDRLLEIEAAGLIERTVGVQSPATTAEAGVPC